MAQPKHSVVRFSDIRVGKVVYRENFGRIQKIQIRQAVKRSDRVGSWYFTGVVLGSDYEHQSEPHQIWLGDCGVGIARYDNRPCVLFTTEKAAKAAIGVYAEWNERRDQDAFEDWYYDEPADYWED